MREKWGTKVVVLVATVFLGVGLAAGLVLSPTAERGTTSSAWQEQHPPVAPARAERHPGQAGSAPADEAGRSETARLAAAAAALTRVPRLQAAPAPTEPARRAPERLAREELPPAVQKVLAQLTSGKKTHTTRLEARERDGQRYIKAEFQLDGVEHEYDLDEQGKVLASEVDVEPSALPGPVASGIQAALPGALLLEAERDEVADAPPFYEVEIKHGGQQMEVHVGEDGKILRRKVR